jgi:hypothetical protein
MAAKKAKSKKQKRKNKNKMAAPNFETQLREAADKKCCW